MKKSSFIVWRVANASMHNSLKVDVSMEIRTLVVKITSRVCFFTRFAITICISSQKQSKETMVDYSAAAPTNSYQQFSGDIFLFWLLELSLGFNQCVDFIATITSNPFFSNLVSKSRLINKCKLQHAIHVV